MRNFENSERNDNEVIAQLAEKYPVISSRIDDTDFRESLLGYSQYLAEHGQETMDRFIYNFDLRSSTDQPLNDFLELLQNRLATEEELAAGVYKEQLEAHVRDAVFELRRKGYNTFESGFDNLAKGTHSIGFDPIPPEKLTELSKSLKALSIETLSIDIVDEGDRQKIVITPEKNMDITELKVVWDKIAGTVPSVGPKAGNSDIQSAQMFREKQDKLKKGEDTYVGRGIFFRKGKFVIEKLDE